MIHNEPSELSGKTVSVVMFEGDDPVEYDVEDWWDRVVGKSWMNSSGNVAAMMYAIRTGEQGLPVDDDVLYGKVGRLGYLVHVNQLVTPGGSPT